MSLPSSMADFVPCDCLLQKAYLLKLHVGQEENQQSVLMSVKKHASLLDI